MKLLFFIKVKKKHEVKKYSLKLLNHMKSKNFIKVGVNHEVLD